jgi:threonine/homoserine/homoserine lactone efflux protein
MWKLFLTGMFISFLGTLPMGMLNISAVQISVTDGYRPAFLFALGVLMVEMAYVRLTLVAMGWFRRNRKLLKWMEYATLAIILALAASSFYTAIQPDVRANPMLSNSINRFWLGASMSAVNPLQVPFWFGWSAILAGRGLLVREGNNYLSYIAGIGVGTFMGQSLFILGGKLLVDRLDAGQDMVHWILGATFLATGLVQSFRMYRKRDEISALGPD